MTPLFCLYHLAILLCFTCWWVGEKTRSGFLFQLFSSLWLFLPADQASFGSSHQPASGIATCNCTHRSANDCWVFLAFYSRHWQEWNHPILARIYLYIAFLRMQVQFRSIEHVRKYNCVASNMCASAILRSIEHVRKCNCVASNMCASTIA